MLMYIAGNGVSAADRTINYIYILSRFFADFLKISLFSEQIGRVPFDSAKICPEALRPCKAFGEAGGDGVPASSLFLPFCISRLQYEYKRITIDLNQFDRRKSYWKHRF